MYVEEIHQEMYIEMIFKGMHIEQIHQEMYIE